MAKNVKKIDHLTEDKPIPNQLWVCMSFLSPEGIRNCKVRGLKIRGVYGLKEDADKRAKELQEEDPDFHVFVGEVGKWLPWDPDPNSVSDQVYKEEELQKLMEAYKKNSKHVKELEKDRKEELMKNAKIDSKKQETINRLRKKLDIKNEEKKESNKIENSGKDIDINNKEIDINKDIDINQNKIKLMENEIKQQEEFVKETQAELNKIKLEQTDNVNTNIDNINLTDNLSKIAQLYKEIHKNN